MSAGGGTTPTLEEYVAPTYLLTTIPDFVDSITYRMLADGMILQDIRAATQEVREWSEWGPFWKRTAERHAAAGEASLADGYGLTAGDHFARASLSAHYGQFLYFADSSGKRELWQLKADLYARAAELISPPAERVELDFGDESIPTYVRVPRGGAPRPCVVQVGGLDAAKEDAHQFSQLCVARGLATVAFDGPGQGEMYYSGTSMTGEYHRAVSRVLDYLETRDDVDASRIGVVGRSTGGFLAPQAAALDQRIAACAAWGAMYDLAEFKAMPPLIKDGFQMVTRTQNWEEAEEAMKFVNLAGLAERITCPLYVLHGGKDNITPPYNAQRLVAEAQGDSTLVLVEDSIHCNHDVAHVVRPGMADWLAKTLGADPTNGSSR